MNSLMQVNVLSGKVHQLLELYFAKQNLVDYQRNFASDLMGSSTLLLNHDVPSTRVYHISNWKYKLLYLNRSEINVFIDEIFMTDNYQVFNDIVL